MDDTESPNLDVEHDTAGQTLYISDEAFEQVSNMINNPIPDKLEELLDREPRWTTE